MTGIFANGRTDGQVAENGQAAEVRPDPYTGYDVAAAFAAQLRCDEVTPGQRATIREELGIQTPESIAARLDHLQSQVTDVAAYTEALEQFLDEEGGAEQTLESLRTDIARTNERLDRIEEQVETAAAEREALAVRLDEVTAEIQALQRRETGEGGECDDATDGTTPETDPQTATRDAESRFEWRVEQD